MRYRRIKISGTTYFFTINLANRKSTLLLDNVSNLKAALTTAKTKHPFKIEEIVILPEHLHLLIPLPQNDSNYSQRINLIKGHFSRSIISHEKISASR